MRRHSGFTLVEMLIAIGVAALMISLVYGAVRIAHRSAAAVDRQVAQMESMRVGWRFLFNAIARATPALNSGEPDNPTGFVGEHDRLEFVADIPSFVNLGGIVSISLSATDTGLGRQLLLQRRRIDPTSGTATPQAPDEAILVERLDTIEIDYFGSIDSDGEFGWHAEWVERDRLPSLVRLSVTPHDAPAWPELVARPTGSPLPGEAGPSPEPESPPPDEDAPVELLDAEPPVRG